MGGFFHDRGVDFHYEVVGAGRPFVFCHGLTGDLEHPKQILAQPPPGWQLILWDCRFHGLTQPDNPSDELSFQTFADDLAALLDHRQVGSAVIGGVSMGAATATRFAADHPERTNALVLVRPAWIDQSHPPNLLLIERIGQQLLKMDAAELIRRIDRDPSFIPEAAESAGGVETVRQLCIKPLARERSLRLRAMPASAPIRSDELPRLTMRAIVIGNENDGVHPISLAHWWTNALNGRATFAEVPSKSLDLQAHEAATRRQVWEFLDSLPAPERQP